MSLSEMKLFRLQQHMKTYLISDSYDKYISFLSQLASFFYRFQQRHVRPR